jgi:dissimilatory sulfite reductase (desulfoviridin) alpha/beta subunit/uncharacterized protein (DUF934 family)
LKTFKSNVELVFNNLNSEKLSRNTIGILAIKERFETALPRSIPLNGYSLESHQKNEYSRWLKKNTVSTKFKNYKAVYISLKHPDRAPGDITATEMRFVANIADHYSGGLVRTSHTQNLLLPLVHNSNLVSLWRELSSTNLSEANIDTLQDIICCPGFEFCSLANTTSIPIAHEIQNLFTDPDELQALGNIQIKISGCMNACGHHHIGHIGILGVDKKGEEWFQITLGGRADEKLQIGKRLGPAVDRASITSTVEVIIRHYLSERIDQQEHFLTTLDQLVSIHSRRPFMDNFNFSENTVTISDWNAIGHDFDDDSLLPGILVVSADSPIELLARPLNKFDRIVITSIDFNDGRIFSLGRQARTLGYSGILTVVGDILPDQFASLQFCGFDNVLVISNFAANESIDLSQADSLGKVEESESARPLVINKQKYNR